MGDVAVKLVEERDVVSYINFLSEQSSARGAESGYV